MKSMSSRWLLRGALLAAGAVMAAAPAARAEVNFAGKTVTMLINFGGASSTNVFGRMLQPFLAKHLPGQPTLIVVNKPGAGGINATTHLYNKVAPDGLTMALFATIPAQVLASGGSGNYRFDVSKFGWLGSVSTVSVLLTSKKSGITKAEDIKGRRKPIFLAAPTARGPNIVLGRLIFRMLGSPYKVITGYRGQPRAAAAVEQGETSAAFLNVNVYVRRKAGFMASGMHAVLQQGYLGADGKVVGAPGVDVPEADAVLRRLVPEKIGSPVYRTYAALRVGSSLALTFFLPPGASEELIATMRKSVQDAIEDPGFKAALKKSRSLPVNFMPGAEGLKRLKAALADTSDPEIRKVLKEVVPPRKKK